MEVLKDKADHLSSGIESNNCMDVPSEMLPEIPYILNYDQLTREMYSRKIFHHFKEGEIKFWPTFKYDPSKNVFDSSSKARSPAWTDRILYFNYDESSSVPKLPLKTGDEEVSSLGKNEESANISSNPNMTSSGRSSYCLELKKYYAIDSRHSDHRPVAAEFSLLV